MITPIKISPFANRGGNVPIQLISTMKHEWYFNNVQNPLGNIITIPDTGSVGGLNISNPALTNKPTASTIGTKISYNSDAVDDYLYRSENQFMRAFPTFMITIVFKHIAGVTSRFLSAYNESNINPEGWSLITTGTGASIQVYNSAGTTSFPVVWGTTLTDGQVYILTYAWNGTNRYIFENTTIRGNTIGGNPILIPTTTKNITTTCRIGGLAGNLFTTGNIGYIGVDEFDLTRLNSNVATLKSTFGI